MPVKQRHGEVRTLGFAIRSSRLAHLGALNTLEPAFVNVELKQGREYPASAA